MTAGEIACRACAAQPGVQCDHGTLAEPNHRQPFHPERILDAAGMTSGQPQPLGGQVSEAAYDQAVTALRDQLF